MAEVKSKFQFLGYQITESIIKIAEDIDVSDNINVNFEQTIGVDEGDHKMRLTMTAVVTDANNALDVKVTSNGYFQFDSDIDDNMKEVFFCVNAPAILFPYIRAYITALSSLSGVAPIIIPTLNLSVRKNHE